MTPPTAHALPLPDNVVDLARTERAWNGARLAVTDFQCAGPVVHRLGNREETCLSTVLEEVGGRCVPLLRKNQPSPVGYVPRHMTLVPAGMEVWGHADDLRFARDASLHFDAGQLEDRLGIRIDTGERHAPRLCFADDHAWTLVRLLAAAVDDPDPSAQLYGDGLVTAISAKLFSHPGERGRSAGAGLAPWQLRRVIARMDDQLPERVELAELAGLAGLSQSHFSKAFKASTGLAPYRWQLDARIRRAQSLLLDGEAPLEQVAEATGFADAVHFGRTFRKFVGASPAAWRDDRKR
ncbi:AraC family transcriptional regulator [Pseudorhodoferax sp. LjRoot39]|uniref:helix-turn-helix domain-containing protein n=1 Tax=Pseudorhodoferax sp. LjRoot39 TaxID=3342328 RepID=UPI003ECCC41B